MSKVTQPVGGKTGSRGQAALLPSLCFNHCVALCACDRQAGPCEVLLETNR